jgi:ABC-type branched-subunit amino acid transport system ATPase component/ABC-type branched-subunit amino acid transport system permease subunit
VTTTSSRTVRSALLVAVLLSLPLLSPPYDVLSTAILAFQYLVVVMSLVLLIGLVGQITLCQATLVGVGAFSAALATTGMHAEFPLNILVGAAAGAATAGIIGVVALRVRGLFFAVATLIFAYVGDTYLFRQTWLVKSQSGTSVPAEHLGKPHTIPFFDLTNAHNFYYIALAGAVFALFAVANLRDSRLGRAFAAIRGSEVAAASLGIDVVRTKLIAFAVAGALAGLSGALTLVNQSTVAPGQFDFTVSLFYLSIAVVGGLRSFGGAISSCVLFAVLVGEVFYRFPAMANYLDVISAVLLAGALLFFRGGLGALPGVVRPWWQANRSRLAVPARGREAGARVATTAAASLRRVRDTMPRLPRRTYDAPTAAEGLVDVHALAARLAPPAADAEPAAVLALPYPRESGEGRHADPEQILRQVAEEVVPGEVMPGGRRGPVLLEVEGITVQFGGLTAVDDAALQVGTGEIVGLIGPNGAGKTTLFNAILGLNDPTAGRVALFGQDVTSWPVHQRAALGVSRTFQALQLFPELSVFDNLLVGTHLQVPTGLTGCMFASPAARVHDRAARDRVDAVLRLMDLDQFADRTVGDLPFGVLRLVEVARALVTGARLICLDEPASGLDSAETERLITWLRVLRQIGVTLLVIEHDVAMVTRLCDHIYVLDQGRMIANGDPATIQNDPAVIASYLGTVKVAS